LSAAELARAVKPYIVAKGYAIPDEERLARMVATLQERAKTLVELVELAHFYLSPTISIEAAAARKFLKPDALEALRALRAQLADVGPWNVETIQHCFEAVTARFGLSLGQIAQPVRVAMTGRTASPGIFEVLEVLGKERTLPAALRWRRHRRVRRGRRGARPCAPTSRCASPFSPSYLSTRRCD
jgi:glutamyl-tRNA synthetase